METNPRFSELLDEWEAAFARGEYIPPESLCAQYPEFLEAARERIDTRVMEDERFRTEVGPTPGTISGLPSTHIAQSGPTASQQKFLIASTSDALAMQPEFEQLRFHAQGGLGTVYLARDKQLNRDVALKFIQERRAEDKLSRERFLLEAEVTGRLEHPGVVPVHGLGETKGGRLFYAMRFIRGETLEAAIRRFYQESQQKSDDGERRLEFRNLLNRFIAVCNTIAYAHTRGIIHRDLKPENILLGPYGETLVADWGLALPVGRDEHARNSGERTLVPSMGSDTGDSSGQAAGTPAYMSPEQASGSPDLGPPSDIYGLGAVLYKILCGKSPISGKNALEVLEKVKSGSFPPPSEHNSNTPLALQAICLKAMSLEPHYRYRTALELAADVEHWLGDEPVTVYAEPRWQKIIRWARQNRSTVQTIVAGLTLLILVAVFSAILLGRSANRERAARMETESKSEQSLWSTAFFAAKLMASEIEIRWRILEAEANDSELKMLLTQGAASPKDAAIRRQIQGWIDSRFNVHQNATRAESWFVTAADGTQVGRSPIKDSIGENFAHRDYFHGQGRDLAPGKATGMTPIKAVHRSSVYRSSTNDRLKVAFSAPVWSGNPGTEDRHVLGVLGISIDLGEFRSLESQLGTSQDTVLVDTNNDWVEGEEKAGLVLYHPRFDKHGEGSTGNKQRPRLDPALMIRLAELRKSKANRNSTGMGHSEMLDVDRHYHDPMDRTPAEYVAAFEPVLVETRDELIDTGWVVIVQEPRQSTENK